MTDTTEEQEQEAPTQMYWEPSWEPFCVDSCGRLWTSVESRALGSGVCGRLWTAVDMSWRSTDQKVGGFESLRAC